MALHQEPMGVIGLSVPSSSRRPPKDLARAGQDCLDSRRHIEHGHLLQQPRRLLSQVVECFDQGQLAREQPCCHGHDTELARIDEPEGPFMSESQEK